MTRQWTVISYVFATLFIATAEAREWADRSGWYRTQGDFVRLQDDYVWIQRDRGSLCRIRIDRLSDSDQQFVRSQARRTTGSVATEPVAIQFPSQPGPSGAGTLDAPSQPLPDPFAPPPETTMPDQPAFPDPLGPAGPAAAGQQAPLANGAAKIWKRIYHGSHSDFHLIVRSDIAFNWTSTVSYVVSEPTTHGWQTKHYLANLQFSHATPDYLHWNARFGDPSIAQWRIARMPDCHGYHAIEAQTRAGWIRIDSAHESVPH